MEGPAALPTTLVVPWVADIVARFPGNPFGAGAGNPFGRARRLRVPPAGARLRLPSGGADPRLDALAVALDGAALELQQLAGDGDVGGEDAPGVAGDLRLEGVQEPLCSPTSPRVRHLCHPS